MIKSSAEDLPCWSEKYLHISCGTTERCDYLIYLCYECIKKCHLYIQIVGENSLTAANSEKQLIWSQALTLTVLLSSVTQSRPSVAHQASLSITNSQSLLKLMFIESVMPSNHLILCHPLLLLPSNFPTIKIFSNESVLRIRWPNIRASAAVLPMNIQGWFSLELTGLISVLSRGLSRVFSSTIVQKHWQVAS